MHSDSNGTKADASRVTSRSRRAACWRTFRSHVRSETIKDKDRSNGRLDRLIRRLMTAQAGLLCSARRTALQSFECNRWRTNVKCNLNCGRWPRSRRSASVHQWGSMPIRSLTAFRRRCLQPRRTPRFFGLLTRRLPAARTRRWRRNLSGFLRGQAVEDC